MINIEMIIIITMNIVNITAIISHHDYDKDNYTP